MKPKLPSSNDSAAVHARKNVPMRGIAFASGLVASLLALSAPSWADGNPADLLPPSTDIAAPMPPETFEDRAARARQAVSKSSPAAPNELVRVIDPSNPRDMVQEPDRGALSAYVPPERTVMVTISRRDVNRIHCPVEVADVFYSKEKPVSVTVAGSDVWVKVLKKVVNGTQESYDKTPVDLHVVCGDAVYTMILQPLDIDSVTLRLGDPNKGKIEAIAKQWGALPIEEKVQRFTRMVYRDELPPTFQKLGLSSDRRTPRMFRNMILQGVNRISAPGLGLAAIEYQVIAKEPLQLDERDFLDIGLSKSIVGITVDPLTLDAQHNKARLIIIERSLSDGR